MDDGLLESESESELDDPSGWVCGNAGCCLVMALCLLGTLSGHSVVWKYKCLLYHDN